MKTSARPLLPLVLLPLLLLVCNNISPVAPAATTPAETTAAVVAPDAVVVTVPSGTGAIYHVSTTGNDAADGGASAPWRTIQHAVDTIAPGDTIWVHAGTYAGARLEQSGTPAAWLTLQAAPGDLVVLNTPGPNNQHSSILELETWEGSETVSYWIVDGFEVTGASGWGIDMRGSESGHSHHLTIRNNVVHDNGFATTSTGIFTAFVDDVLIENNESYNNGEHGIYLSNSGDRPVVRGNRLHHNANCGLHMNGDLSLGGDGTISAALIETNRIYENAQAGGCAAINMDGVVNSTVVNNWLYENHAGGIAIYRVDGAVCSSGNQILHNSIIQASDARWAINITDFNGDGSGCQNNQLFNNVIYNQHAFRGAIELQIPAPPGFASDYNAVIDRFSVDEGDSVIDLAAWQALGYDLNSFIAAPADLFVDPANGDLHLLAGGPAVDAGTAAPGVSSDIDGQARPFGPAVDIGADEYVLLDAGRFLPLLRRPPLG